MAENNIPKILLDRIILPPPTPNRLINEATGQTLESYWTDITELEGWYAYHGKIGGSAFSAWSMIGSVMRFGEGRLTTLMVNLNAAIHSGIFSDRYGCLCLVPLPGTPAALWLSRTFRPGGCFEGSGTGATCLIVRTCEIALGESEVELLRKSCLRNAPIAFRMIPDGHGVFFYAATIPGGVSIPFAPISPPLTYDISVNNDEIQRTCDGLRAAAMQADPFFIPPIADDDDYCGVTVRRAYVLRPKSKASLWWYVLFLALGSASFTHRTDRPAWTIIVALVIIIGAVAHLCDFRSQRKAVKP